MTRKLDPALLDCRERKGKLGGLKLEDLWEPIWVVGSEPCVGSELLDVMPGSEETTSVGREGLEDGRRAPEKTSAQDSLEKELCGGQEKSQGEHLLGNAES